MPLEVLPVKPEDFASIIAQADEPEYTPGDDLVAPPNPVAWPVTTRAEGQARLRACMSLQQHRLENDPSCHFLKVVDVPTSPDEVEDSANAAPIIALARWHRYETGYLYANEAHWEPVMPRSGTEPISVYPANFRADLHDFILTSRDAFRESWIPLCQPAWLLMHLVTRPSARKRGAARMLIEWGLKRAQDEGVPAYLEAGSAARPVYARFGFEQVGELVTLDMRPFGLEAQFEMANMLWRPDALDVDERESEAGAVRDTIKVHSEQEPIFSCT